MRLSTDEFKFVLMHPRIALSYLMRAHRIAKLIDRCTSEVKHVLREGELMEISEHVVHELGDYRTLILGPSSKPRKAEVYYAIVRLMKPNIVVETGVQSGISSSFVLQALEKNEKGTLYSIDLPDKNMLKAASLSGRHEMESGWVVPRGLKKRWRLFIGKSKDRLPPLLKDLGQIDLFLHDSEHSYENMMREYEMAWSHLSHNGVLLSDDVNLNSAFFDFAKRVTCRPILILYPLAAIRNRRKNEKFHGLRGIDD